MGAGGIGRAARALARRDLPHVILGNAAQQAFGFATVLVIARLLDPGEFGIVRVALAYVAVATVVAAGGLTAPVLRYCADNAFDGTARRGLLGLALKRMLTVALTTLGILLLLIAAKPADPLESSVFGAYALQLPALAATSLLGVYLQAERRFKLMAYFPVATRFMALAVTAGATYFHGLPGLLVSSLALTYLACVPLLLATRPAWRPIGALRIPADFSSLAFHSVTGSLITVVGQYADLILLDVTGVDKEQVAVYSLATIFFFSAVAVGGAAQGIATPTFTALLNQPQRFRAQLLKWSGLLSAAAIPLAAISVLVAWIVEVYFLGPRYQHLSLFVGLLMIKFCLWCTYAIGGAALVGIGAIRLGTGIALVTTALTIGIGYPMSVQHGIWGIAWTQVFVALASTVLVWGAIFVEIRRLFERKQSGGVV